MRCLRLSSMRVCVLAASAGVMFAAQGSALGQDKPQGSGASAQVSKAVGTIKSIQVDSITVATESGGDVTANLLGSTRILRVPPGEKDLKNATALQVQDLQPGDRVLVRGQASSDGHTIAALAVIVMKQADVAARQQHDRDDWQKRGVGGLVTKVDAAGAITISSSAIGANRSITVQIAKNTILRRYAPGSVKFDDAKPAPLEQIKAGDQLRTRGTRSPDGSEVNAEEVVTGSFRNIAGTIKAIDASSNTITVQDAIGKSTVMVRISSDSQMKRLPAEMAQRIATRLKGTGSGTNADQSGTNAQNNGQGTGGQIPPAGTRGMRPGTESPAGHGPGGGNGGNGTQDLQRMLSRLPNSTLADLQKGDAVMIVSTGGGDSDAVTAITLLAGVEAILTAAPNRNASSLLSPWSLNTSGGEGEATP